MKIAQTAEKEGITPKELADRNAEIYKAAHAMPWASPTTASSAPRTPTTTRRRKASGRRWKPTGTSTSPSTTAGIRSATSAFYVEDETVVKDDGLRYSSRIRHRGRPGRPRRATSSSSPPIRTNCWRSTRTTRTSAPRITASTRSSASSGRSGGPVHQPHHVRLGRSRPRQRQARHVRLGRCADQLPHRRRLPGRRLGLLPEVLAGRRARDRQGHLPLPRRLLAGVPHVAPDWSCRSGS